MNDYIIKIKNYENKININLFVNKIEELLKTFKNMIKKFI